MSQQRYEGKTLEAVLADVRQHCGDSASIVEANRLRKGGIAGFFARERYEVVVDGEEAGSAPGPAVSTEQPDFAEILASISEHVMDGPAPEVSGRDMAAYSGLFAPGASPEPAIPPVAPAAATALERIGVPDALVPKIPCGGDMTEALVAFAERLPRPAPLPCAQGAVVAVVGDRQSALALARELSVEMGLDEDQVLLASADYQGRAVPSHQKITGAELAAEQRRSWRRRPRPTVVGVDAAPEKTDGWARRVLDALEPTMVWAAVEATRKPEDISAWAERLGGVDALSVRHLDATVSPAAVLQCGIPVGRLEGSPATPALWAACLAPHVTA